ncbi:hypothetical protein GCM10027444_10520 [Actinopolyspora lacussalsi]
MVAIDESWNSNDSPWWAKMRRASRHIEEVRKLVDDMESGSYWWIEEEEGRHENESAYRLRLKESVPAELATAVGDAVHNMRSALDSVAYELARKYKGGTLDNSMERAAVFPICEEPESFDRFFAKSPRKNMYGPQEKLALRSVQPFSLIEEAESYGAQVSRTYENELKKDELFRLNRLSNIDKHRRLPILGWFPETVSWSDASSRDDFQGNFKWIPGGSEFFDGSIVGYLSYYGDMDQRPKVSVFHSMKLFFADDTVLGGDIEVCLDRWHQKITEWILPRIFIVAAGNQPPMMIG